MDTAFLSEAAFLRESFFMSTFSSLFVRAGLRCRVSTLIIFCSITGLLHAQVGSRSPGQRMPEVDRTALHAALEAYDAGRAKVAESALVDLARRYPGNYEANETLGSLLAEAGDFTRAVPYLQKSCVLAPQDAIAHANLGAAYLKAGDGKAAVGELERAANLDPRNGVTQSNLGQALIMTKQPRAAAKAFAAAAAISPEDGELVYNRSLALFESGSAREAAALLEGMPEAEKTDQVYELAGDAEERTGDYGKALANFQTAVQRNPSDANVYALTAELLRHWTWPEAIEVAKFGTSRYPESTHFKMAEGIAYYGKSDYKSAVEVFSGLLSRAPDDAAVADLLGRSCSQLADGVDAGCDGMYEFAQRHPGNAVTTTYAAVAILHEPKERQDLPKAASLLERAVAADPKYAEAYYQMGVLEQARLQWAKSAAALERSIALRPESPEAHYRLSRAYSHLGRRDEAQAEIALNRTYSEQAKTHLDAKMQEVVRFLLKPS